MEQENDNDGIDPQVSELEFEGDPVLQEYQTAEEQKRWVSEFLAARKFRKSFDEEGIKTIERYRGKHQDKTTLANAAHYNLFYANTDKKVALVYAKTPDPAVERRYDDADDPIARVASEMLRRATSWELERGSFNDDMRNIIFDRFLPGFGIGWVRLDQKEGEPQMAPVMGPDGQPTMVEVPGSEIKYQFADIDYVAWDDFLWDPCQRWKSCRWVARRIPMNKADAEDRFADSAHPEDLSMLNFAAEDAETVNADGGTNTNRLKPKEVVEQTTDIYEVWDKEHEKIFWISESATLPLDVRDDTTNFDEFFPTPLPPLGRFEPSSTLPISDYSQVRNLYHQLDDLQARLDGLTDALKLRWVYDASYTELKTLYSTTGHLQGVGIKNWQEQLQEKGGLKNAIEFAPLKEIVETYTQLLQAQEVVKNKIYEIEGITDLMRGESQQYDSGAATALKSQFGTTRISVDQRLTAEYIEKLVRLKCHLICKFYKPETIVERAGQLSQADQPLIGPALQLLKTPIPSQWRMKISVDSIQLPNWNMETQQRNQAVQAVGMMLGQILPVAASNPAAGELGAHLLRFALAGFKGADQIEGYVDQALKQMKDQMQQGGGQQQQPTDAQVKAQATMQKAQLDAQTTLQATEMTTQSKERIEQQKVNIAHDSNAIRIAELQQKDLKDMNNGAV